MSTYTNLIILEGLDLLNLVYRYVRAPMSRVAVSRLPLIPQPSGTLRI